MGTIEDNNEAIKKLTSAINNVSIAYTEILKENDNGPVDILASKMSRISSDASIIQHNVIYLNVYINNELSKIKAKEEGDNNGN